MAASDQQSFRTFCAVELPSEIRSRIQQHVDRLRASFPDASLSWTRVENIHLTLKFFGNVEQTLIPKIDKAAGLAVKEFQPFEILIAGTGVFPRPKQPRVLWIGVTDPENKLAELQRRFEENAAAKGFPKEERAFKPHLTIARVRNPDNAKEVAELNQRLGFPAMTMPVRELVIFRSELSSKGSKYTALSRHKLSNML
jgi:2'-5' RNA ligase